MGTRVNHLLFPTALVVKFPSIQELAPGLPVFPVHEQTRSHQHNRIKKGEGPESRQNAPDPHDSYAYQLRSCAFARLFQLGQANLPLSGVVKLATVVEHRVLELGCTTTPRTRAAKRRKPNAFYWFDENWYAIAPVFDECVRCATAHGRGEMAAHSPRWEFGSLARNKISAI
jgi:hypothetical protein